MQDVHWAQALSRAIIDPLRSQADMGLQGKLPTADGLEQSPTFVRVTANPPHNTQLALPFCQVFEEGKVAAAEQLLMFTIGTRNLEIILGDDSSSPLSRGKSAVIQECLCLSCACMATRGSRKALPSREASGGGLEVRRLGVNLTRRGRDRI